MPRVLYLKKTPEKLFGSVKPGRAGRLVLLNDFRHIKIKEIRGHAILTRTKLLPQYKEGQLIALHFTRRRPCNHGDCDCLLESNESIVVSLRAQYQCEKNTNLRLVMIDAKIENIPGRFGEAETFMVPDYIISCGSGHPVSDGYAWDPTKKEFREENP